MIDISLNHTKQKIHLKFGEGVYFLVGDVDEGLLTTLSMYCLAHGIPYTEVDEMIFGDFDNADVAIVNNLSDALDVEAVVDSLKDAGVKTVIVLLEKFYYSSRAGVKYRYVSNTPELITMFDINVRVGEEKC